ncbi:hypothetical protein [Xanthobacter autotrophicus]|uniref:hypothetical protein n=1 Tax=Xanthobacter autotrophicus TaxID=280 RepID=UPI003726F105
MKDRANLHVEPNAEGTHDVIDGKGEPIAKGFSSNAAAWDWIDRHSHEGRADTDRHHRIRQSPGFT